jgi:putative multiple sugar transport system substrate-binding protein
MSVLKPYIDSGKLVVRSKQLGMDKVSTLRWDGAVAQARMDNLLSAYYTQAQGRCGAVAVRRPVDRHHLVAEGRRLRHAEAADAGGDGQDAEVPSVKSILAKEQTSTVFKDTRELAKVTANMVDAMLSGKQVPVNDTKTYNNGVKIVPSYLLKPVSVDASN